VKPPIKGDAAATWADDSLDQARWWRPHERLRSRPASASLISGCYGGRRMTHGVDLLGPVDWIAVEFPGSRFNGEIAPAVADLVERGIVRVLDLVMIRKDDEGSFEAHEIAELNDREIGQLRSYETQLAMLLSENDVAAIAEAIDPGSSAAVLVWENCWAAPFGAAVRHSGGQVVASGQIPTQALLAALEEDSRKETVGG
jgi:uncharacterized protein DUF6325